MDRINQHIRISNGTIYPAASVRQIWKTDSKISGYRYLIHLWFTFSMGLGEISIRRLTQWRSQIADSYCSWSLSTMELLIVVVLRDWNTVRMVFTYHCSIVFVRPKVVTKRIAWKLDWYQQSQGPAVPRKPRVAILRSTGLSIYIESMYDNDSLIWLDIGSLNVGVKSFF